MMKNLVQVNAFILFGLAFLTFVHGLCSGLHRVHELKGHGCDVMAKDGMSLLVSTSSERWLISWICWWVSGRMVLEISSISFIFFRCKSCKVFQVSSSEGRAWNDSSEIWIGVQSWIDINPYLIQVHWCPVLSTFQPFLGRWRGGHCSLESKNCFASNWFFADSSALPLVRELDLFMPFMIRQFERKAEGFGNAETGPFDDWKLSAGEASVGWSQLKTISAKTFPVHWGSRVFRVATAHALILVTLTLAPKCGIPGWLCKQDSLYCDGFAVGGRMLTPSIHPYPFERFSPLNVPLFIPGHWFWRQNAPQHDLWPAKGDRFRPKWQLPLQVVGHHHHSSKSLFFSHVN